VLFGDFNIVEVIWEATVGDQRADQRAENDVPLHRAIPVKCCFAGCLGGSASYCGAGANTPCVKSF